MLSKKNHEILLILFCKRPKGQVKQIKTTVAWGLCYTCSNDESDEIYGDTNPYPTDSNNSFRS